MATVYNGAVRANPWHTEPNGDALRLALHNLLCKLPWNGNGEARDLRTIGVTSCNRREGVSTVATELARSAAEMGGRRVLLVDLNLAHPSIHRIFRIAIAPGIVDVLHDNGQAESAVRASPVANLSLLPAGNPGGHSHWRLDPAQLPATVQDLKSEFDLVVFDMPAVLEEASASGIASLCDGVLLVIEAERIRWEVARRGQQTLMHAQARVLGAVLNKRQQPIPDWLYRRL